MNDTFNSMFVDAKSKPVVSMLEDNRLCMMKRWTTKREKVKSL